MGTARFAVKVMSLVPWTGLLLCGEALLMRTVARRRAGAGERPWGERFERIGPDWVAGLLREGAAIGERDEVAKLSLERFGEVGQMSVVYRLQPSYAAGNQHQGPESLVLKSTAPEIKNRLLNSALSIFDTEIRAYRLPHPVVGLRRPRCWYAQRHALTGSSILVLDDLSAWRYEGEATFIDIEDAMRVVQAVAEHQCRWWGDGELQAVGFPTTMQMYRKTLGPMCALTWLRGKRQLEPLVDADTLALIGGFVANQEAVTRRVSEGAATLVHGDLNVNNLFFDDDTDRVCAIDWQATRVGSWGEDIAYVAVMDLEAEVLAAHESTLLDRHREILAAHGIAIDAGDHKRQYAMGLFQVLAILVLATAILDADKDPELYASYQATIGRWAIAAKRLGLADLLAEACG